MTSGTRPCRLVFVLLSGLALSQHPSALAVTRGPEGGNSGVAVPRMPEAGFQNFTARDGVFSAYEWNPADLLAAGRIWIGAEWIVARGFAFGAFGEAESREDKRWLRKGGALGVSAIQYFQSQTMKGPFARGDVGVYGTGYEGNAEAPPLRGTVYGGFADAELGYRVSLGDRFTGAAGYGVRRLLPHLFDPKSTPQAPLYAGSSLWQPRVRVNLGIAL